MRVRQNLIAGSIVLGIALVGTALAAGLAPSLLEAPGGQMAVFAGVFTAVAALTELEDMPPPSPCACLITSRIQQIGGVGRTFGLDRMTQAQARALYRLGDCFSDEGKYQEAMAEYEKAGQLWTAIGLVDWVESILTPRIEAAKKHL